jgi:hypothetical protein
MTKLEELKAALDSACAAADAAWDVKEAADVADAAWASAWTAAKVAHTAYQEELKKSEENSND